MVTCTEPTASLCRTGCSRRSLTPLPPTTSVSQGGGPERQSPLRTLSARASQRLPNIRTSPGEMWDNKSHFSGSPVNDVCKHHQSKRVPPASSHSVRGGSRPPAFFKVQTQLSGASLPYLIYASELVIRFHCYAPGIACTPFTLKKPGGITGYPFLMQKLRFQEPRYNR